MNMSDFSSHDGLSLAELVRTRQVTPLELLSAAIERIERHNPKLNAVVHTAYDEARTAATSALPDGPFKGVPFLIKDLGVRVKGWPRTSASRFAQVDADQALLGKHHLFEQAAEEVAAPSTGDGGRHTAVHPEGPRQGAQHAVDGRALLRAAGEIDAAQQGRFVQLTAAGEDLIQEGAQHEANCCGKAKMAARLSTSCSASMRSRMRSRRRCSRRSYSRAKALRGSPTG